MMIDNIERDAWKARFNAVVIPLPYVLRMSQDDEYVCHDSPRRAATAARANSLQAAHTSDIFDFLSEIHYQHENRSRHGT